MRRALGMWALCVAAACTQPTDPEPRPGTSVGNPGKMTVRIAPSETVFLEVAFTDETSLTHVDCHGTASALDAPELDLLESGPITVPGGPWCGVQLVLAQPAILGGGALEHAGFEAELQPDPIVLWAYEPLDVDGESYVLELAAPDWLNPDILGLMLEDPVLIELGSERSDLLAEDLGVGARVFADGGDGVLTDAERSAGPVMGPDGDVPEAPLDTGDPDVDRSLSLDGCNCASSPSAPGPWIALLACFAWRKRRR